MLIEKPKSLSFKIKPGYDWQLEQLVSQQHR